MLNSERSGYAFGANPETSSVKEIIVTAVHGLGNQLKTEKECLDTYTITGENIDKNIERKYIYNQIENGEIVTKKLDKKITRLIKNELFCIYCLFSLFTVQYSSCSVS